VSPLCRAFHANIRSLPYVPPTTHRDLYLCTPYTPTLDRAPDNHDTNASVARKARANITRQIEENKNMSGCALKMLSKECPNQKTHRRQRGHSLGVGGTLMAEASRTDLVRNAAIAGNCGLGFLT